jgi:hypothetical protein
MMVVMKLGAMRSKRESLSNCKDEKYEHNTR